MTPEQLDRLVRALTRLRPFRALVIDLDNGSRFTVTHPEALARLADFHTYTAPDHSRRFFVASSVTSVTLSPHG